MRFPVTSILLLLMSFTLTSLTTAFHQNTSAIFLNRSCQILSKMSEMLPTSDTLLMAHEAAMFSSLSYLDWQNDFKTLELPISISLGLAGGTLLRNLQWQLHRLKCRLYVKGRDILRFITIHFNPNNNKELESLKQKLYYCSFRGSFNENFHIKWFFNNFKEGIWHDTEVLIAESSTTVIIAFRGSDSKEDIATNIQSMESVLHSKVFDCERGAIHRGLLNAYHRVNTGILVDLTHFKRHSHYKYYDRYLKTILDDCIHINMSNSTTTACSVQNIKLSTILREVALSSLTRKKRVIITGHSLGGALATMMTMELLMNHIRSDPKLRRKGRIKDTVDQSVLNRLFLYTFGEVEYGDANFLDCLLAHPIVQRFIKRGHYHRFVSITASPACKSDVVTRIATKVIGKLPDVITGKGGGRLERRIRKVINDTNASKLAAKSKKKEARDSKKQKVESAANKDNRSPGERVNTHLVSPTYVCSGTATSSVDAHSLSHYMRGLSHLCREGPKRHKYPLYLINNLPFHVSKYLGLTRGGICYNNSRSPTFYGYDC